jgi:ABC-type transport system substrate-binding protein
VKLQDLRGRVRDAVVLPSAPGVPAEIATVTRAGTLDLLRMTGEGQSWSTIHAAPMGTGRLSLSPERPGGQVVLYTGQDDGAILRHQRLGPDAWLTETIYLGPQGVRGVVAGQFSADPNAETVAVFGYSGKVQLLSRTGDGPWSTETIFVDRDKGHWLAVAEVDTRNATREIIGSGYGARIFLLSRPPGFGLEGVPTDPDPAPRPVLEENGGLEEDGGGEQARAGSAGAPPTRVAVRASADAVRELSTLSYRGGFETKTLVYETLLTRDARGALAPGLAESWRLEEGGRRVVLTLRDGARWHDGTPVDADAVCQHLRRWVGLPEHAWLRSSAHVERVAALSTREVEIELDEPWALLPDLCAINPGGVRGPGTLDREGEFVHPVGSGPFELAAVREEGRVLCYRRAGDGGAVDLVCYGESDDPLEGLLSGDLDVLADGWAEVVPRAEVARLAADPRFEVREGPGSSVVYLSFRFHDGPTARVDVRRAVRAALDREALAREVEGGFADPCATWAAPSVAIWPRAAVAPLEEPAPRLDAPLRIVIPAGAEKDAALADRVVAQLSRAGLPAVVVALDAQELARALGEGEFDLRLERTWGVPYDPYVSLTARFLPPIGAPTAASERFFGVDPVLAELAGRIARTPEEADRAQLYAAFQARIDEAASIVPLYAPRRLAVVRAGFGLLALDHDLYRLDLSGLARS